MTVTIHQVNADGAGPYTCDIDQTGKISIYNASNQHLLTHFPQTGNSGVLSQNLTVTNNVPGANGFSQAKTQDFDVTVALPDNLACTGGKSSCPFSCLYNQN